MTGCRQILHHLTHGSRAPADFDNHVQPGLNFLQTQFAIAGAHCFQQMVFTLESVHQLWVLQNEHSHSVTFAYGTCEIFLVSHEAFFLSTIHFLPRSTNYPPNVYYRTVSQETTDETENREAEDRLAQCFQGLPFLSH